MKCFKVIRVLHNRRVSSVIAIPCLRKTYRQGKFTKAEIGGLLAFTKKSDAVRFMKANRTKETDKYELWRATGIKTVKLKKSSPTVMFHPSREVCLEAAALAWEGGESKSWPAFSSWPDGTAAFEKLRLDELVSVL